jgi:hypothetical protein
MNDPQANGLDRPAAQSDSQPPPGERISAIAQLGFATVLLLTAVVLVGVSHSYDVTKELDFVKIYNYKKSIPDKSKAVDAIRAHVASDEGKWLNDATDAEGCRDMINFWWPAVTLTGLTLSATCDVRVSLKLGPMEDQIMVKGVTVTDATGCVAGTYLLALTVANGNNNMGTPSLTGSAPSVTIYANKTWTLNNPTTIMGYNFKTINKNYATCMAKRQKLADLMQSSTECKFGYSSPLCTCVRAFSARIVSWQSRLGAAQPDKDKLAMGEVVARGVERCVQLRRAHDVREPIEQVYARSSALLVFAVALLLNGLLNVLMAYGALESTVWYGAYFVGYFVAVLLAGLLDNKGGGFSEFQTVLAMTLPAFIVHGGYCVMLHAFSSGRAAAHELPFLHPVTFDICLCALTLFTLVERGVVQTEYLVAETLKCHVVAAVYIAVMWFHCHGRGREALETEFVQQAYLILFVVGLVSSLSSVVTPYAIKECFHLHWLLPGALTYVAFVNPGWSVHLRMAAKLNVPMSTAVYNFNAVASFLVLFIGGVLLSEFLTEHIQIYGAKNFKWPSSGDPLSYVATRGLILPLPGSTLPYVALPASS